MSTSVEVSVSPQVLQWISNIGNTSTLDDTHLAKLDISRHPNPRFTFDDIVALSKKLQIPYAYFFFDSPVDDTPELFAHRTIKNKDVSQKPSRTLVDLVYEMQTLQDWARQDQIDQGNDKLTFVGSENSSVSVSRIDASIREILNIDTQWYSTPAVSTPNAAFKYLRDRIQHTGVIVMVSGIVGSNTRRKLDPNEFRAFSLIDDYAPLIFINRNDEPETARLFSLVHEFAHILLGKSELYNASNNDFAHNSLEALCNNVASEILMPDKEFDNIWNEQTLQITNNARSKDMEKPDLDSIIRSLQKVFPLSYTAIALRALSHKKITQSQFDEIQKEANEQLANFDDKHHHASGGDYYKTFRNHFDSRLFSHIVASVQEGRTSYVDAYRLTHTTDKTFSNLVEGL